ncbi:Cytosol aminopeptidase PepA (EC [Olavius algarvensis associated proteobacterium Delta 3]|nr:Cytosol aminopeptidase PepA (EC [Olavius algarvensis associated proteobacterium Delta 3]
MNTTLRLHTAEIRSAEIGTLVIPVCEDASIHTDRSVAALVRRAKGFDGFTGTNGERLSLYDPPRMKIRCLVFLGVGTLEQTDTEVLRSFAGNAVRLAAKRGLPDVWLAAPSGRKLGIATEDLLTAILEGAFLGNHRFNRYKADNTEKPVKTVRLVVGDTDARAFRRLPKRVAAICRGTLLARDWVSTPSNDKSPREFARSIQDYAQKAGVNVRLMEAAELKRRKFGALLAVAAGSDNAPVMALLEYRPRKPKQTVALVGKGVTFDTGGINLKPTGSLEDMKMDMAGAAAVAGALIAAAETKPDVRLIGAVPLVENMISGAAFRPGDIVTSYTGKTVEVGNTDAEGRLILIDALAYVIKQYKPEVLIDMATLTGACLVALGEHIAGVFSPDDELAEMILRAGESTHERCWRLPLPEDYKEKLKSDFADLRNIGRSRWGGAILAALFLSEFVDKTRWAHIDIAGPAYVKKATAYCEAGGTGFGVRLVFDLLDRL